jgi:hypothetical protein
MRHGRLDFMIELARLQAWARLEFVTITQEPRAESLAALAGATPKYALSAGAVGVGQ